MTRIATFPRNSEAMQRATRSSLFSALLLSAIAPLGAQNLAPTVGQLLRDRPGAVDPIARIDRSLAFSRAVDVDLDLLDRLDPAGGSVVDVELRAGLAFRAVFERRESIEQGVVNWYGSLEGCEGSLFVLSIAEGAVAATFEPRTADPAKGAGMILNLLPGPGGAHFVRGHLDDLNRCGNDGSHLDLAGTRRALGGALQRSTAPTPGGGVSRPSSSGCCDEDPRTIDVLFVITPLAIVQLGNSGLVVAANAVARMNSDLVSTGVGSGAFIQTIRLVGPVTRWSHNEICDDLTDALANLRSSSSIATTRDQFDADLVAALVGDRGTSCHGGVAGLAYIGNGTDASLGFSVNRAILAAQVVPHEVGHNLGCQHESTSCQTYNNAASTRNVAGNTVYSRMWATLSSSVLGYFSNPDFIAPTTTTPLGRTDCIDNTRRIGETRQGITNFRGGHVARSEQYGPSWPGERGAQGMDATNRPEPGTTLTLTIGNTRNGASTTGVIFLGIQRDTTVTPFGGTRLVIPLIDLTVGIGPFNQLVDLPLPGDPALCGTTWHAQTIMLDPAASHGLSFTNGVTLELGR